MNPELQLLHPYPFEKLRALLSGVTPNPSLSPIALAIGEPKHPTPAFICQALADNLSGLATYPSTIGRDELRRAIADWLKQRYRLDALDFAHQVLPTLGSREAIFALAQALIDRSKRTPLVICPNPFYQIYEGATLLSGARPYFINTTEATNFRMDFSGVPEDIWLRTQMVYTCSPGNPTGYVFTLDDWRQLFALSDRYGFVIAADECYSEIYFDTARPPLGALEAAQLLEREAYPRLIVIGSLSKRSNAPGMRSGFVAGDAAIIKAFTLYRTYHGSAMSPAVQAASIAAWQDEAHVIENRRLYKEKFAAFRNIVGHLLQLNTPPASFYYWARTPIADTEFAKRLYQAQHITVLPGSFLGRDAHGVNPGQNHVRMALVHTLAECTDAAQRIKAFVATI